MLYAYPACFIKEDCGYSVIFPDLNDLATCGQTLDEALLMAVDCLAGHLYYLKKSGEALPPASPVGKIDLHGILSDLSLSSSEAFVNVITVDVEEYARKHFEKSVKKTLTIPAWLNTAAMEHNVNFSQVLLDALRERLHV